MTTLLPAGGGAKGRRGGNSVGVTAGVPVLLVDIGVGDNVPCGRVVVVADLVPVWVGWGVSDPRVGVASGVFVTCGPG